MTKIVSIENLVIPRYRVLSKVTQHKFYRVGVDTYDVNIQCALVPIFGDNITLHKTVYILRKWVNSTPSNFYTIIFSAEKYNMLLCSCRHCNVNLVLPMHMGAVLTKDNEFWNFLVSGDSCCPFSFFCKEYFL